MCYLILKLKTFTILGGLHVNGPEVGLLTFLYKTNTYIVLSSYKQTDQREHVCCWYVCNLIPRILTILSLLLHSYVFSSTLLKNLYLASLSPKSVPILLIWVKREMQASLGPRVSIYSKH